MSTYISVNKYKIRSNEPAIRVAKTKSAKPEYFRSIKVNGPFEMIQSDKPILKCGARLVIKTDAEVEGTP